MKNIEAVFGGILALVVLGAAIFMVAGNGFNGGPTPLPGPKPPYSGDDGQLVDIGAGDVSCQCYDQGFALAGKNVDVLSSQYRTGFESCRAIGGAEAGDYWTAGWNARLSAKPFQASCRSYRNGRRV
ncbi:MAG: hypothetical protein U5J99_13530 [Parvularculaceae bacterium]|nr:hypothetical protein [Parvularculaceae bacterium]